MPERLVEIGPDSPEELKQERAEWLESNGLAFVDFVSWKRALDPAARARPPSRRRMLTFRQQRELDAERDEDFRW